MYKTTHLAEVLTKVLESCHNILVSGAPGIGKSEIIYQVCASEGFEVYEVRLYEQGEAAIGFPRVDRTVTQFTVPFWFHHIVEARPQLVVFDDFHLVDSSIQKYLYRFLTDRIIHNHHLGYMPKLVVAGNFSLESAGSSELQAPVSSRFDIMVEYRPSVESFLEWGYESGRIDKRILAFLRANPGMLYTPDPPPTQMYPSPRTWEKLSKVLAATGDVELAWGIVGKEAASKLLDFWPLLSKSPEEILAKPVSSMKEAEKMVSLYILACHVGDRLVKGEVDGLVARTLAWAEKLNPDMLFVFCRMCVAAAGEQENPRERLVHTLSTHSPRLYRRVLKAAVSLVEGFEDKGRIRRAVGKNVKGTERGKVA